MLYIIAIAALVFLVFYFLWLWLSSEFNHALGSARIALRLRRGGRTPERLLEETQAAFREHGLEPDMVIVSHDALELYDRLRKHVIGHADRPDLPAAVVIALGIDADAQRVYLRAIDTPEGDAGRETSGFHSFDQIEGFERGPRRGPADLQPAGEQRLTLRVRQADPGEYDLAIEPGWHVAASELEHRVRQFITERRTPAAAPVIVR